MSLFATEYPNPDGVDDFFRATKDEVGKKLVDTVMPNHPTFKQLEKKGNIQYHEPGRGPAVDLLCTNADRGILMSKSRDFQNTLSTPNEATTRAYYDWIMRKNYLTVGEFEYKNSTTEGMVGLLTGRMKSVENAHKQAMIKYLWEGVSSGNEHVFGISEGVQFDPTVEPAAGPVGLVTLAKVPQWKNVTSDFGAANSGSNDFKVVGTGGALISSFLDMPGGLQHVYRQCEDNADGEQPDLIATNAHGFDYCQNLVNCGRMFRDDDSVRDLGVSGFRYHGAIIYYDRDLVAENDAEATYYCLNTNSFAWTLATGLVKDWGEMEKLQGVTAFRWPMQTQFTMVWMDRRRNGVLYNVGPYTP